jgi:hypothetical protein
MEGPSTLRREGSRQSPLGLPLWASLHCPVHTAVLRHTAWFGSYLLECLRLFRKDWEGSYLHLPQHFGHTIPCQCLTLSAVTETVNSERTQGRTGSAVQRVWFPISAPPTCQALLHTWPGMADPTREFWRSAQVLLPL